MSILETFYILFKTNADKAAHDIDGVDRASDRAASGLRNMDRAADNVGASFVNMAKGIAAPIAALASLSSITSIFAGQVEKIRNVGALAVQFNDSAQNIDAWGQAIARLGGNADQAQESLKSITERFSEAAADTESGPAKLMERYGVQLRDAEGRLLRGTAQAAEIQRALIGRSEEEKRFFFDELNVDNAFVIKLLTREKDLRQELEAITRRGAITNDDTERVERYDTAVADLNREMGLLGQTLTIAVLPYVIPVVEALTDLVELLRDNGNVVQGSLFALAIGLTGRLIPALWSFRGVLLALVARGGPIGLLVTAIGAIGIAYDDLIAFLEGRPSVLGKLLEGHEQIEAALRSIARWFQDNPAAAWGAAFVAALVGPIRSIRLILSLLGRIPGLARSAAGAVSTIGAAATTATGGAALARNAGRFGLWAGRAARITNMVGLGLLAAEAGYAAYGLNYKEIGPNPSPEYRVDENTPLAPNAIDLSKGGFTLPGFGPPRETDDAIRRGQSMLNDASSTPLNTAGQTKEVNVNVTVGQVNVEAKGMDANEVGRMVSSSLKSHVATAFSQVDDGVLA